MLPCENPGRPIATHNTGALTHTKSSSAHERTASSKPFPATLAWTTTMTCVTENATTFWQKKQTALPLQQTRAVFVATRLSALKGSTSLDISSALFLSSTLSPLLQPRPTCCSSGARQLWSLAPCRCPAAPCRLLRPPGRDKAGTGAFSEGPPPRDRAGPGSQEAQRSDAHVPHAWALLSWQRQPPKLASFGFEGPLAQPWHARRLQHAKSVVSPEQTKVRSVWDCGQLSGMGQCAVAVLARQHKPEHPKWGTLRSFSRAPPAKSWAANEDS